MHADEQLQTYKQHQISHPPPVALWLCLTESLLLQVALTAVAAGCRASCW
jgi:hypothetical protein